MSSVDQQTFRDIVNLLIPHCADADSRKSLIDSALFGCHVLDQIDWTDSARDFTVRVVRQLLTYGECEADKPAIVMLLVALREQVGLAQQSQIDALIAKVSLETVADSDTEWHIPDTHTGKHVFISYSRGNLDVVRQITTDLLNAGIHVWIDQVGLKAGTPDWEQALRDAIHDAEAVLFMASPTSRRSPYVRDELAIADMEKVPVYPVWVDGDQWMDCIPLGRGYVQFIDVRNGAYPAGLQQIAKALAGEPVKFETQETLAASEPVETQPVDTSKSPRNPYKGLRAFRAEDEQDFFGRDTLIEELIDILGNGIEPPRLLAVLGASGSGKSSVVMAGLLPQLQKDAVEGSADWRYLDPIVPGTHPIESLTIALARLMKEKSQTAIREDLMNRNTRGLYALTRELSDKSIVLYIDQFEELFTLVNDESERRQFIDLLTTAITEPHGTLIVMVSMRADFYDRPAQYQEFGTLIEECHVLVKPMSLADLYDVVQKPAQLPDVNLDFDEGLVAELVFAVREEVAALPLLQFTLDQLFERRDGRTLTLHAYEEMGGVQGALAQHAETTFNNLPSQQHKILARALFLRLIEAGATEQDTTRRRATSNELILPDAKNTRILRKTADAFVDARLLVSDQTEGERTIEVSHEAIIREWERLGNWLRDAREDLRLQKALSADVLDWMRRGQPKDMLYRGSVLLEAREWRNRNTATRDETVFLRESFEAEVERKRREKQTAQRIKMLVFGLVGILVIGSILLTLILVRNNATLEEEAAAIAVTANANSTIASIDIAEARKSIAELEDLAPGATAGAEWDNWAISLAVEEQIDIVEMEIPVLSIILPIIHEFDNVEMVSVPSGCFQMGSEDNNQQPIHEVCFEVPFWIDRFEVTNAQSQYGSICTNSISSTSPDQPANCVAWLDAFDFCQLRNARLPSEAEWEYAARGPDSKIYPWGNDFSPSRVVYASSGNITQSVGSPERGVSWIGAYNMSGNVSEWVNTIYDHVAYPYPYTADDGREEFNQDANHVLRGGSIRTISTRQLQSAYRNGFEPNYTNLGVGFRCARDSE